MSQQKSAVNAIILLVGVILLIAGAAYGLYLKYGPTGMRLSEAAVQPPVLGLAVVGLILIIVGGYLMSRKAVQKPSATQIGEQKKDEGKQSGVAGPSPPK